MGQQYVPRNSDSCCDESIVFQVEDTIFKTPRRVFIDDSELFRDLHDLPSIPDVPQDGTSDAFPLRLDGICKEDFCQLLRVLCPSALQPSPPLHELTVPEWISVLKLTTMWSFKKARATAINALSTLPSVEKIRLATIYDVPEWHLEGLIDLAQRPEPLTLSEAEVLGLETVIKLSEVRESFSMSPASLPSWCGCGISYYWRCGHCGKHGSDSSVQCNPPPLPSRKNYDFTPKVRSVFRL